LDVSEDVLEDESDELEDELPELPELPEPPLDTDDGMPCGGGPPGGGPCMAPWEPSLPCDDDCRAAIILSRNELISSELSDPSPSLSMAEKSCFTSDDALSRPNSSALTLPSPLVSRLWIGSSGAWPPPAPFVDWANCVVEPPNWNWLGGGGGPSKALVVVVSEPESEPASLASENVASLLLLVEVDALAACAASKLQSEDALEVDEMFTV
jgi:hypothetical protein